MQEETICSAEAQYCVAPGGGALRTPRLMIVTTVPETLATILRHQPRHLSRSFEVHLVTSCGPLLTNVVEEEHAQVAIVPMVRGIHPLRDIRAIASMLRVVRRVKPDIIHSYTPKAGLVAMVAGLINRVPVRVHTFTGLIFPTAVGLKRLVLMAVDRVIACGATHVVPESQGVLRDLQEHRITRKRLEVIGYGNIAGVDTAWFHRDAPGVQSAAKQLRKFLQLKADDFVFCFVGRINRDKGISELLAAFDRLPSNAHLIVVGAVDNTAPVSNEASQLLASHARVHALGFLDDVRPALCVSHALVLPSYREGFPNVVLQAGAMGLPVIATDVSGSNEVVEPSFNGWVVPVRQVPPLAAAMIECMNQSGLRREKMGRNARMRVQERYERRTYLQELERFYERVSRIRSGT
jgi:glycosyltransferase involved in cell wall biosynthesis